MQFVGEASQRVLVQAIQWIFANANASATTAEVQRGLLDNGIRLDSVQVDEGAGGGNGGTSAEQFVLLNGKWKAQVDRANGLVKLRNKASSRAPVWVIRAAAAQINYVSALLQRIQELEAQLAAKNL